MDLLPCSQPWSTHREAWVVAVTRLRTEPEAGSLVASVLTPLVDHFERAWLELGTLAAVAGRFTPPPGSRPMPIQHLAAFTLDDLLDVFRSAANEVQLLIPDGERWNGDPSPEDILDEVERLDRYLTLARLAAAGTAGTDPFSTTVVRVADALANWSTDLPALVGPIREILEAVNFGAADGFSAPGRSTLAN
jgi:hypothetical protein